MIGVKGFQKGVVTNPNGRPPKEREAAYLLIMKEVMTANEWRNLCIDAYMAARGIRIRYVDGKADGYENDPLATPASKLANKRFFADYLLPKTLIIGQDEDGELVELLKSMAHSIKEEKEERLDQFVDDMKKHLSKLSEGDAKPS